jgi:hypothetical protein
MARKQTKNQNIADLSKNTRVKLIASLKSTLATLTGALEAEISSLNADAMRPMHRVSDLAPMCDGAEYLEAPENVTCYGNAWATQLGHIMQDVKQLKRRILRAELMAKGE